MMNFRLPAFLRVALLALPFVLVSCGFQPLYQKSDVYDAGASDYLSQTYIENIPDREGQFLRNALIDRFYKYGTPDTPDFRLTFTPIREVRRDLDITKSSDATRGQLTLSTSMVLRNARSGETLLQRDIQAMTSYNILNSQFTTRVSEQNARENALNMLAQQAENQLALYYKRESP